MSRNRQDMLYIVQNALKALELPPFVSFDEIKQRYFDLSKKYHPDSSNENDDEKFLEISRAYEILKEYIKNYRYSFDEEEIHKQYPENYHNERFRF